jgi:hypothetical protein
MEAFYPDFGPIELSAAERYTTLAETPGYAASFSSPLLGKRRVLERHKPLLMDQLQPSTNSDKLSEDFLCEQRELLSGEHLYFL